MSTNNTSSNRPEDTPHDANRTADDQSSIIPEADVLIAPDSSIKLVVGVLSRYWWLIGTAALIAGSLATIVWWSQGPIVRVHFEDGHGIKPDDAVKYRGIEVGRVQAANLKEDGTGVFLELQLTHTARHLVREGTQFWIERPHVSLTRVQGLDTVVGAKYVEMLPGPEGGKRITAFRGSETPIWIDNPGETELRIDFREGWGLREGAPLRYRSVDIGEVMGITLDEDLQTVQVRIRLTQSGTDVARVGSQFWIEHADISVAGITGLDTILGGGYVAVIPGSATANAQRYFVGLDEPPATRDRSPAGLEIILTSSQRRGLARGAAVSYRGIPVGRLISVGLAADAATVEARVYIQPQYKHLVRPESKFWHVAGFQLDAGVSGVELELDSIETLLRGGIAMATPDDPGAAVTTGQRFAVQDEPDDEWLRWKPTIAIGLLPSDHRLPAPARVRLEWQSRRLGFRRTNQMFGWLLPLDSQQWIGLADFLAPTETKREHVELEVEGQVFLLDDAKITTKQQIALLRLSQWKSKQTLWPATRMRIPTVPEDCLLVTGDSSTQMPLAAGRLHKVESGWSIDTSISFDETDWHGACVVATADAMLVGILSVEERTGRVVFIPHDLAAAAN